jgi:DNA polymerase elongation subunit (family B)
LANHPDRRRLFLDIETSPMKVYVWDLKSKSNAYIPPSMIAPDGESKIICVCWKWAGGKTVHSAKWSPGEHDDKEVITQIIDEMDKATEIVMQNGDRFDVPWIRARAIYHEISMRPKYPTIDTLKKSRQKFRFPSHRLDYLGQHLLGEGKIPTSFGLWRSIIEDDCPKAMAKMVKYCKQDVRLLEKVFERMFSYIEPITHVGDTHQECPECGVRMHYRSQRTAASGYTAVRLWCIPCKRWLDVPLGKYMKKIQIKRKVKGKPDPLLGQHD